MNRFLPFFAIALASPAFAGQAPGPSSAADIPVSHTDRVYAAEQFSNTVSVSDPASNKLLGVIRLGDPQPGPGLRDVRSTRRRRRPGGDSAGSRRAVR